MSGLYNCNNSYCVRSCYDFLLRGKIKGGAGEAAIAGLVGAWIGAPCLFQFLRA